ncbi:MAG: flagellin [Caulobacteraceae bacterium]|nr:flagellin [Caulobacteraceae bacterium]
MNRISTANSYGSVLSSLMNFESAQVDVQKQIASGHLGDDLKSYARKAETLTATQSVKVRIQGYIDQSKNLANKFDAQDLALSQISDAADGARGAVANAMAAGGGQGLMDQLQSMLSQAGQGLNAQYAGRYLFAGGQINTAPLPTTDLTTVAAAVDPTTLFTNDQMVQTDRLDETTTVQSGLLASNIGGPLLSALKAIKNYADANGGLTGKLTTADQTFLQGQLASLDAARSGVTDVAAVNGMNQQRVDKSLTAQEDRQASLESLVGDLTEVDMAAAATRLSQIQTGLQAGAQIFASLRDYSLLNFLK